MARGGKTAALGALGGAAGFAAGQVLAQIFPQTSPVTVEQLEALLQRFATSLHDDILRDVTAELGALLDRDELRRISASLATTLNEFRVPAGTSVRMLEQMFHDAETARNGLMSLGENAFSSLLVILPIEVAITQVLRLRDPQDPTVNNDAWRRRWLETPLAAIQEVETQVDVFATTLHARFEVSGHVQEVPEIFEHHATGVVRFHVIIDGRTFGVFSSRAEAQQYLNALRNAPHIRIEDRVILPARAIIDELRKIRFVLGSPIGPGGPALNTGGSM